MKLNYYMRGLGVGIVVTAVLMGIALSGGKEEMTDEMIRQRAMEMGMVDGTVVLSDMTDNDEDAVGREEGGTEDKEAPDSLSGNGTAGSGPGNEDGEEGPEEEVAGADSPAGENPGGDGEVLNEVVVISIDSGDGSRVVANKLLQAGLIDDAAELDDYLCRNGYDKRLKTGRHDIPSSATYEEIAAAITKKGY